MKKICLLFMSIFLGSFLHCMENEKTLDVLPRELILSYMFPENDPSICYRLIKLRRRYGVGENKNRIIDSAFKSLLDLANLSVINKKMYAKRLLDHQEDPTYFSANDIYMLTGSNPILSRLNFNSISSNTPWFVTLAELTKKNQHFGDYKSVFNINYQTQYLVRNYKLHISLMIDSFNCCLKEARLYENFYALCEEGEKIFDSHPYLVDLCQTLKKQASDKEPLDITDLKYFFYELDNTKLPKDALSYKEKVLALCNNGEVCARTNLSFGFEFYNELRHNSEWSFQAFRCIYKLLTDTFCDKNTQVINVDQLLQYIQGTFTDDTEKTNIVVNACRKLLVNDTNPFKRSINTGKMNGAVLFNVSLIGKNESLITSDELLIPFDLIHPECLKNDI